MLFTLKKVIGNMLLPLPLMLLIIGAGLALLWFSRFQKTGKIFISIGWLALLLLSLQPVADRLLRPIESTYPTWNNSQKVDYIIVLLSNFFYSFNKAMHLSTSRTSLDNRCFVSLMSLS